ncbi:MAG TPA: UDP-glucuronic acid decarboxylase family protein [Pseudonocardiaceae bacterium]|jgi:dTDP-glucose 4,6-dehydratase|nr:UDP-glucuronic acid decarboxylase family protein [Pseudonocardiaceae bacterium]
MPHNIQRSLVTGGAGFLGSHLCDRLLAAGTEVDAIDNFATSSPDNVAHLIGEPGFRLLSHDITEPIPAAGRYDTIFHLASAASPPDYLRLPVETLRTGSRGTEQLLELALRYDARFVLASTSEVYGDPAEHPQPETYWGHVNPIGPRSVYDEAKRYAEALTMAYRREEGANTGIARIFNTYGPRMRPFDGRMVPTFIRQALSGEPLTIAGSGRQTRSLCYVDDTVRGLVALAHLDHSGPVNLGNPQEIRVADLAAEIVRVTGSSSPLEHIEAAEDDPQRRCPDITRARAELGWSPEVGMADGLRRTVAWFAGLLPQRESLR